MSGTQGVAHGLDDLFPRGAGGEERQLALHAFHETVAGEDDRHRLFLLALPVLVPLALSLQVGYAFLWTEATWNPATGGDRVSPGCDRCYAQTLAERLKAMGSPKYQDDGDPSTSGPGFKLTLHRSSLDVLRRWSASRLVFVDSMSDLFGDDVPPEFIVQVFGVISETPQHTCQVLTKRAQRLSRIAGGLDWPSNLPMGVSVETRR